jgi:hypothetical protein
LTLGAFDLVGEGESWLCEALADGTDLAGNPVPVEVAIQTLIQDGSVSYTEKYDNATITIRVCLSGPDAEALDDGAAALFAELGKPNVLTYAGPQALGSVAWDVVNSHLERNSDDLAETRGERYYTISLSVLPFRRDTVETVTAALPAGGSTTTNVNSGSSTTGWTGTVNGAVVAPATSGGAVSVTGPPRPTGDAVLTLALAGPIDTSTLKLIAVDWQVYQGTPLGFAGPPFTLSATSAGLSLQRVGQRAVASSTYVRTWFLVPTAQASLTQVTFSAAGTTYSASNLTFGIDKVDKTDVTPMIGGGQQTLRTIEVDGSARTPGAIAIEHETAALGDVLAFFWADDGTGYAPPCSPFHVSGAGLVSDANAISGNHENINAIASVYDIPVSRVPRDGYLLDARIGGSATGTVTWTITTRVNGVDLGPTLTGSRALTVSGYAIYALGAIQLPTRDLDEAGAGAVVRISLVGTADFALDEVLIYRDSGRLVGPVACGTGTPSSGGPSKRLFIEPASLSRPRPVVRRGHAADRSDSFHPPSLGGWEFPEFKPPRVNVHIVTTNTTGAAVSFRHYKRLAG